MKLSQLRQDPVSGDWIVIAPTRSSRPHSFAVKGKRARAPKKGCPFENPRTIDHSKPILEVKNKKGWSVIIIENKFPAFVHRNTCPVIARRGPYAVTDGIGYHDVVITRGHDADFPELLRAEACDVFHAFQDRYLMLLNDPCIDYVSIFHNWGQKAGASLYHPHYQIIAIPVVPPDFEHSVSGAMRYHKQHKECVHCAMIAWERKEKRRIIFENRGAIAFAPFVSRTAFEVRVFPKRHLPYFENTVEADITDVVEALQEALKIMRRRLGDPDYNFFIHTAPIKDKKKYQEYHWHIEVLPKLNIRAGFELGTGIEINPVDPDHAARVLKGK